MSRAFSIGLLAAAFGAVAFIGSLKRVESSSTAMRAGEIGDPTRSAGLLEHLGQFYWLSCSDIFCRQMLGKRALMKDCSPGCIDLLSS